MEIDLIFYKKCIGKVEFVMIFFKKQERICKI